MAYHHGNLPTALLDAVESAIAECGVSGVSLRDVARRAGVSHSAPAHHFGSKAGMLTAFATMGYQLLAESVSHEAAAIDDSDCAAQVAAMGQGYVRFAVSHPAHFELMFRADLLEPADHALNAARDTLNRLLVDAVERCRVAGYLHGRPAPLVVASAWSLVHGLASLWISGRMSERTGELESQAIAKAVTELFVSAVLPRPSATGRDDDARQPSALPRARSPVIASTASRRALCPGGHRIRRDLPAVRSAAPPRWRAPAHGPADRRRTARLPPP